VHATIAMRAGKTAEAEAFGTAAAQLYASLGWPLLEANALELAGNREIARTLYDRCGAIADLRRLADLPAGPKVGALALLSARESEVAALVARGLRNTEIAKRLNVGSKTVEKHLSSVFGKLGLHSRSQVVAFMAATSREGGLP
jgi:DNA-binding NarL/FixJ family response regulator